MDEAGLAQAKKARPFRAVPLLSGALVCQWTLAIGKEGDWEVMLVRETNLDDVYMKTVYKQLRS